MVPLLRRLAARRPPPPDPRVASLVADGLRQLDRRESLLAEVDGSLH